MLRAAETVKKQYPNRLNLTVVNGLPFDEYVRTMLGSDAIMDQLYSYTPSMNPLEAMAHGIICIGGGEPENYEIINETTLRLSSTSSRLMKVVLESLLTSSITSLSSHNCAAIAMNMYANIMIISRLPASMRSFIGGC